MIYVVSIQGGKFVKVGYTKSDELAKRIAELQTASPYEIKASAVCEGSLKQEKTLHYMLFRAFNRIRIPHPPNEWYPGKVKFMRDFINHLSISFDSAYSFLCKYQPETKQSGKDLMGEPLELTKNVKWPGK